jgi:hypothetical protein
MMAHLNDSRTAFYRNPIIAGGPTRWLLNNASVQTELHSAGTELFEQHRGATHLHEGASKNKVSCAPSATHAGCCIGLQVVGNGPFVTVHTHTHTNICKFPAICPGSPTVSVLARKQMKNARLRTARRCVYIPSLVSQIWCFPVGKVTGCSKLTHRTHTNGHTLFRADTHRSLHPFAYSNCLPLCIPACFNAFHFRSFRLHLH